MTTASDLLGYQGKRVLVVGGATGMGAAAAQIAKSLGAHVTVMDFAPVDFDVDKLISLDLSDQDSVDRAVDELDGQVDSLFSAAGVADGPKLMRVNFIGHRHLIERLFAKDLLPRGAAICFISSVAGMGWENDSARRRSTATSPGRPTPSRRRACGSTRCAPDPPTLPWPVRTPIYG
jgi:NAD(P)-dependent dehydrogenase (short-subunit alcohol dehydrogenase family)